MPNEQYNAFISYAWADNEHPVEGGSGWVSAFLSRLRGLLGRELRRQAEGDRVFIDYERLRRNQPLSDSIRGVLSSSRLLVPVVSPSYSSPPAGAGRSWRPSSPCTGNRPTASSRSGWSRSTRTRSPRRPDHSPAPSMSG